MLLETGSLQLRRLRPEDAAWIAREIANPKVQRWLTSPPHPYRVSDAEAFVDRYRDDPGFRIIEEDGRQLGMVSIGVFEPGSLPELGYWLQQADWSRGVMSRAAGALVDWFFTAATTDPEATLASGWIEGNAVSQHLLEKLGFRPTGEVRPQVARFLGREVPVHRAELQKDRWQARKAA